MTFFGISLSAAITLALAAWAIVTAAHFLHRRYQRVTVPSLRFWQAALKKQRQDSLVGKWRHPWIWLLLCTLIGLLILAMMQPARTGEGSARPYVVMVDCRASMGLPFGDNTNSLTRLDQARDQGQAFLKQMDLGTVTLVAVTDTATVLAHRDDPLTEAGYQLDQLTVSTAVGDRGLQQALALAASLVDNEARTGVIWLTDHPVDPFELPEQLRENLYCLDFSSPMDNIAVVSLERIPLEEQKERVVVWLANWGINSGHGTLSLLVDGQAQEALPVTLAPGEFQEHTWDIPLVGQSLVAAEIYGDNLFTADNRLALETQSQCKIHLPSNSPFALQALVEANPTYQVVTHPNQADVWVELAPPHNRSAGSLIDVLITPSLCTEAQQRQAWQADLFVDAAVVSVPYDSNDQVLLETPTQQALAIRSGQQPMKVTLSPSLFTEQATVWKQAQFLPLMDRILRHETSTMRDMTLTYSNLLTQTASMQSEVPQETTLRWHVILLWIVFGLALFEIVCFYRGKIV